jgi:hypothetical protein
MQSVAQSTTGLASLRPASEASSADAVLLAEFSNLSNQELSVSSLHIGILLRGDRNNVRLHLLTNSSALRAPTLKITIRWANYMPAIPTNEASIKMGYHHLEEIVFNAVWASDFLHVHPGSGFSQNCR